MFQKIYDWIKNIKTPTWLRDLLGEIESILMQVAFLVGKTYIDQLTAEILRVSSLQISGEEKFNLVFKFGKKNLKNIKDSYLNLIIESLVNKLKTKGII
jgi:hypothetical protein